MNNKDITSHEIEELSRKYRILPQKITYILSKYGSMKNYVEQYMNNGKEKVNYSKSIFENDKSPLEDNVSNQVIVDVAENSDRIGLKIFFIMQKCKYEGRRITFFDSSQIAKGFEKLNVREKEVICLYARIQESKYYDSIMKKYGENYLKRKPFEREFMNAMYKLSRKREVGNCWYTFAEKDDLCLSEEERKKRTRIFDEFYNSNLIFIPDNEFKDEPDSITHSEKIRMKDELCEIKRLQDRNIEADSIKKLNLPTHIYHSLEREGIFTIAQLKSMTDEELAMIKGIGKYGLEKIKSLMFEFIDPKLLDLKAERDCLMEKLNGLQIKVKEAEKLLASYNRILDKKTIDSERSDSIQNLYLPKHLVKKLQDNGIETISQLKSMSEEEIVNKYRRKSFKVFNNKRR